MYLYAYIYIHKYTYIYTYIYIHIQLHEYRLGMLYKRTKKYFKKLKNKIK